MNEVVTGLLLLYIVGVVVFTVWYSISAVKEIRRINRLTREIRARTARIEAETERMRSRR